MSSSPDTSPHTTGAPRAPRRAPHTVAPVPPSRYEPYLDGLFTYCLSVLCDHDAATEVLGDVLAISERQYGRCPSEAVERRAWLYAIARWACLRKVTERRRGRQGAHSGSREPERGRGERRAGQRDRVRETAGAGAEDRSASGAVSASSASSASAATSAAGPEAAERRHRELALLAWPEAAGTTPEQREALELAVRHRLGPGEVAAVLSLEPPAARELLASAACEVERTRAALAVVDTGGCPSVARLTGDDQVLLSAALRRELVRHVDDCPRCRRAAERAGAADPWPGSRPVVPAPRAVPVAPSAPSASRTPADAAVATASTAGPTAGPTATLPLVTAPRSAAYTAMTRTGRARSAGPRFGRNGFPMDPKDRAARRDRLRARAVTTTVVATVVAAPVLALWAAYRGAPQTGEGRGGSSIAAGETGGPAGSDPDGLYGPDGPVEEPYEHYENAGSTRDGTGSRFIEGSRAPGVSVEIISDGVGVPPVGPDRPNPGRITVEARPAGDAVDSTLIILRASGGEPVSWTAGTEAPWLRLSRHYGTLAPGESATVRVTVDHRREPSGPWSARIALYPAGVVVKLHGYGVRPPATGRPGPGRPGHTAGPGGSGGTGGGAGGGPTPPPATSGPGTARPTDPAPPTPADPTATAPDPGGSSPPGQDPSGPAPSPPDSGAPGPADPPPSD
ncbi:hypothetical protein [Streptomyces sp. NPDC093109]|uniref:hypothetical protein n=1 Tax=Streptomyces sp. NPDC093109 TaxID=3154977 RepID=UPI00344FD483